MRLVETLHNWAACRTFTVDQPLSNKKIYYSRELDFEDKESKLYKLFDQVRYGPLVNSVTIFEHGVRIEIQEAFEHSKKDWDVIRENVFYSFANFFDMDINDVEAAHSVKDDRTSKYKESQTVHITLFDLSEALKNIAIPHDFRSHREAWRNAIIASKTNAESIKHLDDSTFLYWEHELKTFDAAFDALEALKLPEK